MPQGQSVLPKLSTRNYPLLPGHGILRGYPEPSSQATEGSLQSNRKANLHSSALKDTRAGSGRNRRDASQSISVYLSTLNPKP